MKFALFITFASAAALHAAPTYTTDGSGGSTTDLWDVLQGSVVVQSPQLVNGSDDIREAFGTSGGVESGNVIFLDGPGIGSTDTVYWQTAGFVNLSSMELRFSQDGGGSPNRSTAGYTLYASQDGVNFNVISTGSVPLVAGSGSSMVNAPLLITDSTLSGTTSNVRGFRLDVVRNSTSGPRFVEADGYGTAGMITSTYLDRIAFNASSNTAYTGQGSDDEAPGMAISFTSSPLVAGGADDVEGAFGNNNGPVEGNSTIFGDGGTADNGNATFGDGGEFVDFFDWDTSTPITLAGFRIGLAGDGGSPDRDTELVRFLVEGVQVDLFDNDGFNGDVTRLFAGGPVTGDDFRIEFTRTTTSGARIFEIDAILGVPVPEPSTFTLTLAAAAFALRRRRSA